MNGLDLFSGIGGISLGLRDYVRPIAYYEIDAYCQGVLLSRMHTGELPRARIWDDVRTFSTIGITNNTVDIIYGGFPCQDISVAGNGKGLEGERSGLFYEIIRIANEIKPRWIFLENVPAITTRGGLEVVKEIAKMGYDCRWITITASSVGALHKRERWFLLGHSQHNGSFTVEKQRSTKEAIPDNKERKNKTSEFERTDSCGMLAEKSICNSNNFASKQTDSGTFTESSENGTWRRFTGLYWPFESREHWQEIVSSMGKCSNGISNHVDRLRALGNAVVPQQVKEAFEILMGLK